MLVTLLQTKVPDGSMQRLVVWSLAVVAVFTVGLVLVARVKKRMQADAEQEEVSAGFTLSDLRRMHKAGEVSNEEFEKAKARVIDAARRAAARTPQGKAATAPPPAVPVLPLDDEEEDDGGGEEEDSDDGTGPVRK
jgi:hydrogenase maturation factor HypE